MELLLNAHLIYFFFHQIGARKGMKQRKRSTEERADECLKPSFWFGGVCNKTFTDEINLYKASGNIAGH